MIALNSIAEWCAEVVACPTVREHDGLAYSSRNVRLRPSQRQRAVRLGNVRLIDNVAVNDQ